MLLPREFVTYLSRQIVRRLSPLTIETAQPDRVIELVNTLISDELDAEDKLNAKNALIQQKKIVRASGRDTGDAMKLSRDKITDISHKLITSLRKSRDVRLRKDQNDVRLDVVKVFTEILQLEEKSDRAARDKVRSMKRDIPEGSEEWDILQKRYYAEELKKYGIDPSK